MTDLYRLDMSKLKVDGSKKKGKELPLAGTDGNGGGGRKCYSCGKHGHKAAQCHNKQGNGNGQKQGKSKFTGKCNHCAKVGHRKADCWDLPENAEKKY
mmetsp:Transcript_11360/g.21263  ORF Transcript_11360/g.21263 Transcript_11360/m.21263 type:complete len:98 (+) Transcript_11360:365-658(+)